MSSITSEGLAQEQRVLNDLCSLYTARLQLRGITPERLTAYAATVTAMEKQRSDTTQTGTNKLDLTQQEEQQRTALSALVKKVQQGAKNTFPDGSPLLKDFHIGERLTSSTPLTIAWGKDLLAQWLTYKDVLIAKGGLIQTDIDELQTAIQALEATDTAQELAKKKGAPEATAAFKNAMETARQTADSLHGIATVEFKNEPNVLKQFELAKKLRYQTSGKGNNNEPPPMPPTPPVPPTP